ELRLNTYGRPMRRQHPELAIPFESYVPGTDQIARLVEANSVSRPVYLLGNPKDPGFNDRFDLERAGFATQLRTKGTAPDLYRIIEQKIDFYRHAHYPPRLYPDTAFESGI